MLDIIQSRWILTFQQNPMMTGTQIYEYINENGSQCGRL